MKWTVLVESNLVGQYAIRTHILEFCRALSRFSNVTIITHTPCEAIEEDTSNNCFRMPVLQFKPTNLAEIFNTLIAYSFLRNLHKAQPIEVLYIRATAFGLGPLLFARRKKITNFLEINGAWDAESALSRSHLSIGKRLWVTPIQRVRGLSLDLACKLAHQIIVVTPQLAVYLQNKGIAANKISVVPNGVNPQHFNPLPKELSRQRLGIPLNEWVIGFTGSLAAWQGLDILIEAFNTLSRSSNRTQRLLIVGDGTERPQLEVQAMHSLHATEIQFTGAKPYCEIPEIIAACDVLVAPKRPLISGYSTLKVLEYLACARPVIASRLPGLELIEEAHAGFLFTPNDPFDLANALTKIRDLTEEERMAMGDRGRQLVLSRFTWEHTANAIISRLTI